ncbi:sugar kinase [Paraglaciecola sp. 2405UD69-4]|uniref:sugar kinase n=1 Tax=Paraglaciecola sp. 2405UD69-4 TaxID=3391836 RepID=UPI0039C9A763
MQKVVLFGECMLELKQSEPKVMRQSFAGDAYNTAVYMKRLFSDQDISFMTAVGQDPISNDMLSDFTDEGLNNDLVFADDTKTPGIYLVQVDETGERSFLYWRDSSAARQAMKFVDDKVLSTLTESDVFFFSGISLAVIEPAYRTAFWDLLNKLSISGVKIIFDPNYRARLWRGADEAKQAFEKAFSLSDMLLPGIDDFEQLYGLTTVEQVVDFCKPYNIAEMVIKNGPESLFIQLDGQLTELKIKPVENVVDTTSAGDSFNGGYIGARLAGHSAEKAAKIASSAAACVIQHPGAIAPKEDFLDFMKSSFSEL